MTGFNLNLGLVKRFYCNEIGFITSFAQRRGLYKAAPQLSAGINDVNML